jgi:hypothetical protein
VTLLLCAAWVASSALILSGVEVGEESWGEVVFVKVSPGCEVLIVCGVLTTGAVEDVWLQPTRTNKVTNKRSDFFIVRVSIDDGGYRVKQKPARKGGFRNQLSAWLNPDT